MYNDLASPGLATISYRIATEPNFIEKLRNLVEIGKLESVSSLSEADAAALKSFIESDNPFPKNATNLGEDPGEYETWIG